MAGIIPFNRKLFLFAAKIEATIGTKIALANTDAAFRVMNPRIVPAGQSAIIPAGTGLADIGQVAGAYSGAVSFDMELYNNSSSWPAIFLPSCGFALSNTANTYQICDVVSPGATGNSWKSVSTGLWFTTKGTTLTYGTFGAMGALSLQLTAGMPAMASFSYSGVYTASPGSLPAPPTYDTTLPPVFNAFTVDGSSAISLPSVSIDAGDYVSLIAQPNTQGAVQNAWLRKQNWRLRMEPLQDSTDWINDWLTNGTGHTFSCAMNGGSGNIITVSGQMVQASAPQKGERDENLTTPLEFAILNNSLTIAFS